MTCATSFFIIQFHIGIFNVKLIKIWSKEENVFRWPPQNILKWDKYNELPDLIDAHGRGHKMAIINPFNSRVDTTEPDEIFESEEGDFSD